MRLHGSATPGVYPKERFFLVFNGSFDFTSSFPFSFSCSFSDSFWISIFKDYQRVCYKCFAWESAFLALEHSSLAILISQIIKRKSSLFPSVQHRCQFCCGETAGSIHSFQRFSLCVESILLLFYLHISHSAIFHLLYVLFAQD